MPSIHSLGRRRRYPHQVLRFRAFGFPIHIHFSFLLLLALFLDSGFSMTAMLLWTAAILVSVLLHELGHAATVRRFGGHVERITIYALGGATLWREGGTGLRSWKHFVVAAAGSGVGLLVGLGTYLFVRIGGIGDTGRLVVDSPWRIHLFAADVSGAYLAFFIGAFISVSVVWGLFNWIPIGGLDGSKMLRVVLIKFLGPGGDLHSRIIGMAIGVAAAVWLWQRGARLGAVIVVVFSASDLLAYRRRASTSR